MVRVRIRLDHNYKPTPGVITGTGTLPLSRTLTQTLPLTSATAQAPLLQLLPTGKGRNRVKFKGRHADYITPRHSKTTRAPHLTRLGRILNTQALAFPSSPVQNPNPNSDPNPNTGATRARVTLSPRRRKVSGSEAHRLIIHVKGPIPVDLAGHFQP